ncbi:MULTISPECIES: virulence factor TspB C-terminal domain-related protein [Pseudomonas]|uniref:virulence factor TspB C-terminal domain-related protein n=1 Tax=Pseudomonas nitroreducens TaxID=46680 RepID=UPI001E4DAF4C|nr:MULTISPECIES: virulence factor TspB C-terminal domain-related protein [Pseudomonas]MCE4068536.1 hypothetical protein [Pseudomonas nitritireducens]MCE4077725.1 hypothetical protein [Pseudomonas nitroreducens]
MGDKKGVIGFLFFVLLACSLEASALDYYWYAKGTNGNIHYATPRAGCDEALVNWKKSYSEGFEQWFVKDSETQWRCRFKSSPGGTNFQEWTWIRAGDSCTAPATYDPNTGACKTPSPDAGKQCKEPDSTGFPWIVGTDGICTPYLNADAPARCKRLSNKTEATKYWITFSTDGNPQAPPSPEKYGCKVSLTIGANCKPPAAKGGVNGVSLAPAQASHCLVAATFTGEAAPDAQASQSAANPATGQDGECAEGQDCTVADPPKVDDKQDCNYTTDAEGRKVCSSSQFNGDPGNMDCGSVNGKFTCVTKPASSNGIKIDTSIKTTANSDGSATSVKTDVSTKSNCPAGSSSCKVTTTTTTTTTHKGSDGSITGTSSETTCKGDECSGASTGGGGGGNNGKGDDTTNCDPATDPKACEGGSTDGGGKKCDAPIQCDGDAVLCAILQQQHKDTCELMADPSDEERSKFEQDKAAETAKVDKLQSDLDDKASSLFSDFQAKASGNQYGGQCLQDKQVDVMGATISLPFSQVCPYIALLRYAVVAMAYLAAARIVSRGI